MISMPTHRAQDGLFRMVSMPAHRALSIYLPGAPQVNGSDHTAGLIQLIAMFGLSLRLWRARGI